MKWQIGVKSKAVDKNAHVVTYNGRSYYRLYRSGDTNPVSTSDIHPYYPPCSTLYDRISTTALSASSSLIGYKKLPVNGVVTLPAKDQWIQVEFTGRKHGEYGMIKFEKPGMYGGFFVKTIRVFNNNLVFDYQGDGQKFFTFGVTEEHTFHNSTGTYCVRYTGKNGVFVIQSSPGLIYDPPSPNITPTPTPTPTDPTTGGGKPTGDKYWSTAHWPSSGEDMVLMWFDSAQTQLLSSNQRIPVNSSPITKWMSRGKTAFELIESGGSTNNNHVWSPTYLTVGNGINSGPGLRFTQRYSGESSFLYFQEDNINYDYRATFIVASTSTKRGEPRQGLVTGATKEGGVQASKGNMFEIETFRSHWSIVDIGCPGLLCTRSSSIYSDTHDSGVDAGQYYLNGLAVPDTQPIIPASPGAIYGGVRTTGIPAYVNGLSVGASHTLVDGIERGWNGNIGEIIILNDEPTDIQREEIEGYLAWKWGLVPLLPPTHRWKNEPPYKLQPTPTPAPPPPEITPTAPPPPPEPLPPVSVNVVTPQQLFDTLRIRQGVSTLWTGGMYQTDWLSVKNKIDTITSNDTLLNLLVESNIEIANKLFSTNNINISDPWHTSGYDQMDVDCPGSGDTVLRHGYPENWTDNNKSRFMYCLASIMSGDPDTSNKRLYELLHNDNWRAFTTAVMNPTEDNIAIIENILDIPLFIKNPSYNYNHLDIDVPMTPLYQLNADKNNPSPVMWNHLLGLEFDLQVSRFDVVMELMYDEGTHLFWQKPVIIGDTTVEITVDLPGLDANQTTYKNTSDLRWKVNVEIGDTSAKKAIYSNTLQALPPSLPEYIADTVNRVEIPSLDGCNFIVTPYCGRWPGNTTNEILDNVKNGIYPKLLCRVDRNILK